MWKQFESNKRIWCEVSFAIRIPDRGRRGQGASATSLDTLFARACWMMRWTASRRVTSARCSAISASRAAMVASRSFTRASKPANIKGEIGTWMMLYYAFPSSLKLNVCVILRVHRAILEIIVAATVSNKKNRCTSHTPVTESRICLRRESERKRSLRNLSICFVSCELS